MHKFMATLLDLLVVISRNTGALKVPQICQPNTLLLTLFTISLPGRRFTVINLWTRKAVAPNYASVNPDMSAAEGLNVQTGERSPPNDRSHNPLYGT